MGFESLARMIHVISTTASTILDGPFVGLAILSSSMGNGLLGALGKILNLLDTLSGMLKEEHVFSGNHWEVTT